MQPAGAIPVQPWMTAEPVRKVLSIVTRHGATARFVGGCVRDALLGRPVDDIDIATDQLPDRSLADLRAAGITTVDAGLKHGTVAAYAGGMAMEVTTLRIDVRTDGRRAEVAFTDDWAEDAGRRDFTFNALYADPDGTLYDPTGGRGDLEAGRVRFVGEPAQRIAEDRLRILRFFRFHAWLGRGAPQPEALAACSEAAAGIDELSGERICTEMLKLLAAPDPFGSLLAMRDTGVLARIVPGEPDFERLRRLTGMDGDGDPLRRLAALLADEAGAAWLARRYHLSRRQKLRLLAAVAPQEPVRDALSAGDARLLLYLAGPETATDLALLAGDAGLADAVASEDVPVFRLHGRDILSRTGEPGPEVGVLLQAIEDWWIAGGLEADRPALLAELDRRISRSG